MILKRTLSFLSLAVALAAAGAPAPAASEPASWNTELLAHRDTFTGRYASCWGYTNPANGHEYAIVGNVNGTIIYRVTDPRNPVQVGFILGPASNWREMKTYRQWLYVVTEGGGGIQIVSLANPDSPVLVATYSATVGSAHTVTIDSTSIGGARLYANGASGGMHILSLANPTAPVEVGVYSTPYVHDCYVTNDTCYAACIGIQKLIILDCRVPADIDTLKRWTWIGAAPHNAWRHPNTDYLLTTDETNGGKLRSWDISGAGGPIQVDEFLAHPTSDCHNVQIRGNTAYVAHYTEGIQVLDVADPTAMARLGFYDTFVGNVLYNGLWGTYNDFPSGTIVGSDINSGMFLVDFWENGGAVDGVVTSTASGLPIPYASVKIVETGKQKSVSGLGAYLLDAPAASYTLRATAFGFDSSSVAFVVAAGDTGTQNLALTPLPGGGIAGSAVRAVGMTPLAGAAVTVDGTPLADTTDGAGAFSIAGLPAGAYRARMDEYLFMPDSADVTVPIGSDATATFRLEAVSIAFNFEDTSAAGWVVNLEGNDNVTQGAWFRGDPNASWTWDGRGVAPADDHTRGPLTFCWHTGFNPGGGGPIDVGDVDVGKTTLSSPVMDLTGIAQPTISYWRWFSNDQGEVAGDDPWKAQISSNGGTTWVTVDSTKTAKSSWTEIRFRVSNYVTPTATVRMRFIADDSGSDSVVEAALDDFRVWGQDVVGVVDGSGRPQEPGTAGAGAITALRLWPSAPNPARAGSGEVALRFDLPRAGKVTLAIYTVDGRRVAEAASGIFPAGSHVARWRGADETGRTLPSGVYLARLSAGGETATRKLLLVD